MTSVVRRSILALILAAALLTAVAGAAAAEPRFYTAHEGSRVVMLSSGCVADQTVSDTGNLKFLHGSGYIILRAALHVWFDDFGHVCGESWTNGWYYCWMANCSNYSVGYVQTYNIANNPSGNTAIQSCHFDQVAQGHWASCNAPQAAGVYNFVLGHHVYGYIYDNGYNQNAVTGNYAD